MAPTTTVEDRGRTVRVEASGSARTATADSGGGGLDLLVGLVLDCPDDVPDEVVAEAVRGLEALGGGSLGATAAEPRVVLQRRFGRALGRSGWTSGRA